MNNEQLDNQTGTTVCTYYTRWNNDFFIMKFEGLRLEVSTFREPALLQGVKCSYFLLYSPIFWGSPTFLLHFRVISYILLYFRLDVIICFLNGSEQGFCDHSIANNVHFYGLKNRLWQFFFPFFFHFRGKFFLY